MVPWQYIRALISVSFLTILFAEVLGRRICGKVFGLAARDKNVIRGEDAEPGTWPWMVMLTELNERTGDRSLICSGVLIDKRHVLIPAHCFRRNGTNLYSTRISHLNMNLSDVYSISHIALHVGYEKGKFYDNIALVTLSEEVNIPNINPVCLPPRGKSRNLTGRRTTFVGWSSSKNEPKKMLLKQLEAIPIVSNEFCNEAYGEKYQRTLPRGITSGMICAELPDRPGKDNCIGSSGGPLMIQERNRWFVVGMGSFGVGCGSPVYPDVYTRVSEYLNWMMETKGSTTSGGEEVEGRDCSDPHSNSTGQCVPLEPRRASSETPVDGVHFGNTLHSRQEFILTSDFLFNMLSDTTFTMEFKTSADNGVMFFVSDGVNVDSYLGLVMRDGKLVYVFDCGSGSALISSEKAYNDGNWHRVELWRHNRQGQLVIDDNEGIIGNSPICDTGLSVQSPIYIGGVDENVSRTHKNNLLNITSSFPGCIGSVEGQGKTLVQVMHMNVISASFCYSYLEKGTFFTGEGHLELLKYYDLGHLSIALDIKPQSRSGVLMAAQDEDEYFILQLIDGRVELTFNNVTTTYNPADENYLFNGQFHTIRVSSFNSSVKLTVDSEFLEPWIEEIEGPSWKLHPLYIGGLTESSWNKSLIWTDDQFGGCMRNLKLNQIPISTFFPSDTIGHVTLDNCPTA